MPDQRILYWKKEKNARTFPSFINCILKCEDGYVYYSAQFVYFWSISVNCELLMSLCEGFSFYNIHPVNEALLKWNLLRKVDMYICTDQLIFCSSIHIFISLFGWFFYSRCVYLCFHGIGLAVDRRVLLRGGRNFRHAVL